MDLISRARIVCRSELWKKHHESKEIKEKQGLPKTLTLEFKKKEKEKTGQHFGVFFRGFRFIFFLYLKSPYKGSRRGPSVVVSPYKGSRRGPSVVVDGEEEDREARNSYSRWEKMWRFEPSILDLMVQNIGASAPPKHPCWIDTREGKRTHHGLPRAGETGQQTEPWARRANQAEHSRGTPPPRVTP